MEALTARRSREALRSPQVTRLREAVARPYTIFLIAVSFWAVAFATVSYLSYRGFLTRRFDLGNMVQAVWSTAHGRPLSVTEVTGNEIVRLGVHVDPLLVVFAPLWRIWPSPALLVTVQAVAVALSALPLYWLGRKHLQSEKAALFLALAYLLHPALEWQVMNDFHPTTLAIPFLLVAIWFADEDKPWHFAAACLPVLASQEHMGVFVAGLGIWYAFRHRRFAFGACTALISLAWVAIAFEVVIPHFSGGPSLYLNRYAGAGDSPLGIFGTLFSDPLQIAREVGTPGDVFFLLALMMPFAGLFLRAPGLALVAAPQVALSLLSSRPSDLRIDGHINSPTIPILAAATVLGVAKFAPKSQLSAAGVVLLWTGFAGYLLGPLRYIGTPLLPLLVFVAVLWMAPIRQRSRVLACAVMLVALVIVYAPRPAAFVSTGFLAAQFDDQRAAREEAISLIPAGASVSATNHLGSHLSARRSIYSFPLVDPAEWIVIDRHDTWMPVVISDRRQEHPTDSVPPIEGFRRPLVMTETIRALKADPRWAIAFESGDILVFRRTGVSRATSQTG